MTNWPPPTFSPDTGLFYVPQNDSYALYYLTETDPRGAMGLGGKEEQIVASAGTYLTAIDYKTAKIAWRHRYPGTGGGSASGLLTTAGKLLFGGDLGGNLAAYDPANRKALWHSRIGQVSNSLKRTADVHARWASIYIGGRRGWVVCVYAVLKPRRSFVRHSPL